MYRSRKLDVEVVIKHHILLVAHGSRRQVANLEVQQMAIRLGHEVTNAKVTCAFLELAEPSIPAALQAGIDHGADNITIVPYFLANGRHVAEDIPALVALVQEKNPAIKISISPYIGGSNGMIDLLLQLANSEIFL